MLDKRELFAAGTKISMIHFQSYIFGFAKYRPFEYFFHELHQSSDIRQISYKNSEIMYGLYSAWRGICVFFLVRINRLERIPIRITIFPCND